jgi:hypothetical protein
MAGTRPGMTERLARPVEQINRSPDGAKRNPGSATRTREDTARQRCATAPARHRPEDEPQYINITKA